MRLLVCPVAIVIAAAMSQSIPTIDYLLVFILSPLELVIVVICEELEIVGFGLQLVQMLGKETVNLFVKLRGSLDSLIYRSLEASFYVIHQVLLIEKAIR